MDISYVTSFFLKRTTFNAVEQQLQDAICSHIISAEELGQLLDKNPLLVNQRMINGEFPLHVLVCKMGQKREAQFAKIEVLLRHGVQIDQRDSQGLTALDHAAFIDREVFVKILSLKIGKEISEIEEQLEVVGNAESLQESLNAISQLKSVDFQKMSPTQHAAYSGVMESFTIQDLIHFPPNENGEKPLHFAIKGGQTELVRQIVQQMKRNQIDLNPIDLNPLDLFENSCLHYAVATEKGEMIQVLIQEGVGDLNQKNTRGETSLHYAAALRKVQLMKELIEGGADLKIADSGGRVPLMMFSLAIKEKDPLRLSESHLTLCGLTALYWVIQVTDKAGLKIPYISELMSLLFLATTAVELNYLLDHLNTTAKKFTALVGYLTLGFLPPVNFGYHLWRTMYAVQDSFSAMNAARKNPRRKWDATCKIAVTGINTASSVNQVYKSFQTNKYLYDLYHSPYFLDLTDQLQAIIAKIQYGDFSFITNIDEIFRQFYGGSSSRSSGRDQKWQSAGEGVCKPFNAADFALLSDAERVGDSRLEPKCSTHAAIILSTAFDKEKFCGEIHEKIKAQEDNPERLAYLKRVYRAISLLVHPDKLDEKAKKICQGELCFRKVHDSFDTLGEELRHQNYCKN